MSTPLLTQTTGPEGLRLEARGAWTASHAQAADSLAEQGFAQTRGSTSIVVDLAALDRLDTYGAFLIGRLIRRFQEVGTRVSMTDGSARFKALLDATDEAATRGPAPARSGKPRFAALETIGRAVPQFGVDLMSFAEMLGALSAALIRSVAHPRRFRLTSVIHHLDRVGWQAMPIMLLISFLIGAIIAQQGIFHFRKFGADVYVVDLVAVLVLREIAVLLISIMSAGRSGSSYTAELGSMKMREEIDALRTMGLDPVEILLLPRVLAIVIAVPILTFFGSIAALYGGGLVSWLYGGMSPAVFVSRLQEAVSISSFKVGMIKAPFMALVIGVIACSEGLRVKGSAESLGQHTTSSVVKAIFLVIVLDGLFAVFFAAIGV